MDSELLLIRYRECECVDCFKTRLVKQVLSYYHDCPRGVLIFLMLANLVMLFCIFLTSAKKR